MGRYVRKTQRYNGKKYEATGKTELEALTKLAEKIAAAKRGEETIGGSMTVDAWYKQWYETYKVPKGLRDESLRKIRSEYRTHIAPYIGRMKLRDVRDIHLQKLLNEMAGMSGDMIHKVYGLLRGMFGRARISRMIVWDPSEGLQLPAGTAGSRRSLTDDERAVLLQAADSAGRGLWIRTMLYTGMRPGETAALRWSSVDFDHNEIHVVAARESGSKRVKGPKTAAGVRDIPIHAALRPLLLAARGEPFSLVFPDRRGGVATMDSMRGWFRTIRRHAEKIAPGVLGDDLSAYCLRHTFATDLQKAGVAINVAKALMGHADIQTTANIYTHSDAETLHGGIRLLDGSAPVGSVGGGNRGGNG